MCSAIKLEPIPNQGQTICQETNARWIEFHSTYIYGLPIYGFNVQAQRITCVIQPFSMNQLAWPTVQRLCGYNALLSRPDSMCFITFFFIINEGMKKVWGAIELNPTSFSPPVLTHLPLSLLQPPTEWLLTMQVLRSTAESFWLS